MATRAMHQRALARHRSWRPGIVFSRQLHPECNPLRALIAALWHALCIACTMSAWPRVIGIHQSCMGAVDTVSGRGKGPSQSQLDRRCCMHSHFKSLKPFLGKGGMLNAACQQDAMLLTR